MSLSAETAYNILRELSPSELQRLDGMREKDAKKTPAKVKSIDPVWPLEVFIEKLVKQLNDKKQKRINSRSTTVAMATPLRTR